MPVLPGEQAVKPITVVNKATGEIFEFAADNDAVLAKSYMDINETIKALERAKKKIRDSILPQLDDSQNDKLECGEFVWKKQVRHYMNYDKAILREAVDADLYDTLVKPDKSKVDALLRDNAASSDPTLDPFAVKLLRETMYDEKTPSVAVTLERNL